MAVVDLATGKIFGCEEGSKTYLHEQGHIYFNNTETGAKISYYQQFFMMVAVFFGALSLLINNILLYLFTFMNALGMICCYLIEEVYCWVWAFKNYKKD